MGDTETFQDLLSLRSIETESSGEEMSCERRFHTRRQPNQASLITRALSLP